MPGRRCDLNSRPKRAAGVLRKHDAQNEKMPDFLAADSVALVFARQQRRRIVQWEDVTTLAV